MRQILPPHEVFIAEYHDLLTPREISEAIGIKKTTIRAFMKANKLPHLRADGTTVTNFSRKNPNDFDVDLYADWILGVKDGRGL